MLCDSTKLSVDEIKNLQCCLAGLLASHETTGLDGINQAIHKYNGIIIGYKVLCAVNSSCVCRMIYIFNINFFLQICWLFGKGKKQRETTVLLGILTMTDKFLLGSHVNIGK